MADLTCSNSADLLGVGQPLPEGGDEEGAKEDEPADGHQHAVDHDGGVRVAGDVAVPVVEVLVVV